MATSRAITLLSILLLACGLAECSPVASTDDSNIGDGSVSSTTAEEETVDCEGSLTNWSPWSMKETNIRHDSGCGTQVRTRAYRTLAAAAQCADEDLDLSQFAARCSNIPRKKVMRALQHYFVDDVFSPRTAREPVPEEIRRTLKSFPEECHQELADRPVDLLIMLDKSDSMRDEEYKMLRSSMAHLITRSIPNVSGDATRVSLLTFATYANIEWDFNACRNKACYRNAFNNGTNSPKDRFGITRLPISLEKARTAFTSEKGSRTCSRKVILLVTDGSDGKGYPEDAAIALRDDDVEIFIIGLTRLINEQELRSIASNPTREHLFYIDEMDVLKEIFQRLRPASAREEDLVETKVKPLEVVPDFSADF
ncbi:collagen alpha-1(XIV) chain-like [Sycon ciliatum]|uniref:collagen alpha-1(XIV) chain-like n=1 Tax=Sycon ciliatum TaxID=27933 RepID=UPI0020A94A19|eukprot:scpid84669/ scgid30130/ Matrilin-3